MDTLLLIEGILRILIPLGVQVADMFTKVDDDLKEQLAVHQETLTKLVAQLKADYDEIKLMDHTGQRPTQRQWAAHDARWTAATQQLQDLLLGVQELEEEEEEEPEPEPERPAVIAHLDSLGIGDKTA